MAYINAVNIDIPNDVCEFTTTLCAAPVLEDDAAAESCVAVAEPVVTGVVVVGPVVCDGASVMMEAICVGGTADPTPVPVYCAGIERVAVLGFSDGLSE